MTTIGERVRALRIEKNLSQAELATAAGVSTSTIGNLEAGIRTQPRRLNAIAAVLGANPLWLETGRGDQLSGAAAAVFPRSPAESEYALIPQYSTRGACGTGYMNDHVEVSGGLAFKREWLTRLGLDENNACVIYADGDSMSNNINDGDVVLLDTRQQQARDGQVYALLKDGETVIKRIQRQFGMVLLHSDNPDKVRYPSITVPPGVDLEIIGRVVWRGGGM
ncbi:HTH-type transcriptional regulator PrtR [Andreprevotia sp. IGB-42]|uniref:XRE family transcriptional regulator n=1 Tax=Andreprevotia sp. IGB-42 TaxID=2497473 RepID=UPI001359E9B3|nr:XRE family transcriptional regulator [Andreprevotia sp. IGB-42]KAF0811374.1 HTH-type transcriptional regulator PrtR [Andreprevotia sp. IGB-42]